MECDRGVQLRLRRYLLGTASGAALFGGAPLAHADGAIDHIYIDGAGQYSFFGGGSTAWANPFFNSGFVFPGPFGPGEPHIGAKNGWDTFDDIALQSGDWYLTLAADYGRTGGSARAEFDQKYTTHYGFHFQRSGIARAHEDHIILDLTVGKDVGLGMLGLDGSSIVSGGLRYVHFLSQTASEFEYEYGSKFFSRDLDRQFMGVGPIITWKARTPVCPDFSFSWGASAALVIGERSFEINGDQVRHTGALSPQFGGNIGLTWQMPDSPLSLTAGYRANAYLQVYDSGFKFGDEHTDRIIHGPFAQVTWQVF